MAVRGGIAIGAAVLAAAAPSAQAQDEAGRADRLVDSLTRCRAITAADARLACFDAASAALLAAREKREITIIDREGVRQAKRGLFGFSLPKIRLFGRNGDKEDVEPEVREIESTVSAVAVVDRTLWSLRLADGSMWQTTEQSRVAPRTGDAIKIEAGILGSYKATIRGRHAGKVKRVR